MSTSSSDLWIETDHNGVIVGWAADIPASPVTARDRCSVFYSKSCSARTVLYTADLVTA